MTRELLQQAIDALETIPAGGADLNQLALTVAGVTLALRAALEAPQPEPVKGAVWHEGSVSLLSVGHEDAYCARRGAQRLYLHPPAAPQGEPFGYVTQYAMKWDWKSEMVLKITRKAQAEYGFTVPLYAAQPAAPSVPASQWIACAERMPDADIDVLAFVDEATYIANYEPDGWYDAHTFAPLDGITHWMDLPEAPNNKEEK